MFSTIKELFEDQYPGLFFKDLQMQDVSYQTNDACTHFKHPNNQIYSWSFPTEKWIQHDEEYQKSISFFWTTKSVYVCDRVWGLPPPKLGLGSTELPTVNFSLGDTELERMCNSKELFTW